MSSSKRQKPKFDGWKLASFSAAQQLFQTLGSLVSLFLIGSVGSNFPPTYAALMTCVFSTIGSCVFLLCDVFNINDTLPEEWIFWESVYVSSFSFLFLLNTITMAYGSIRWSNTYWWLSTIICSLVSCSFTMNLVHIIKKQKLSFHQTNSPKPAVRLIRFNQR